MIIRVKFEGTVRKGKKRSTVLDFLDIHATDKEQAKEIFTQWLNLNGGIRGSEKNVYHPLSTFGSIIIKSAEEVKP